MGLAALGAGVASIAGTDGWRALARLRPLIGLAVLALLLAPWWATYLMAHRAAFAEVVSGHYGSWVWRRGVLARLESLWVAAHFLPWTILLVAAVVWWRRAEPDAERRAIGWWALATWALIALSGIHRVRYLVPIYPGLALLVGEFIVRGRDARATALLRRATYAVIALLVVAAALGLTPWPAMIRGEGRPWVPETGGERGLIAGLLIVSAGAALAAVRRRAFVAAGFAVALGLGATLLVEGLHAPPRFARDFDVRPLTAAARRLTAPGAAVAAYPDLSLAYDFYLGTPVIELGDGEAVKLVSQPPRGALIVSPRGWNTLAPHAHGAWEVVATQSLGGKPMLVVGQRTP
jgi:hypothetical protein